MFSSRVKEKFKVFFFSSKGSIFVETALIMPVVLAIILIAIWFGVAINNLTSFTSAVANAPRLAVTRGAYNVISDINCYYNRMPNCDEDKLRSIFCSGSFCQSKTLNEIMLSAFKPTFDLGIFNTSGIPISYYYALAYVFLAMKQSVGNAVYYPCNVNVTTKEIDDQPGCLACLFLNPETFDQTPYSQTGPLPEDKIALECYYKPKGLVVSSILGLLGNSGQEDNAVGTIIRRGGF